LRALASGVVKTVVFGTASVSLGVDRVIMGIFVDAVAEVTKTAVLGGINVVSVAGTDALALALMWKEEQERRRAVAGE
jgi:hypothetical protein